MDSSRRLALARALKARTKATVAKDDAPEAERNPSETPQSPTSPHTAQTTNSPHTLQTPNSPPPIVAVPLVVAHTSTPAPLDKGKGILVVPSDDEGSGEGQVLKRRRTNRVISSRSASPQRGGSLRDNPPSATSPTQQLGQEEGAKSAPPSTQAPATQATAPETLEIPSAIMQLMRGFNERSSGSSFGEAKKEGMPYYMGAFLAIALDWRAQAKTKAIEMQALQALKREVATLKEEKLKLAQLWEQKKGAYKTSLVETRKAEEAANLRLHEAGQKYADLLGSMVPLQAEVAELRVVAENSKVLGAKLSETEEKQAAKIEALNLLQAENGKLQAEVNKLQVEKEFLDKQLASQNSKIEELEKSNQELIDDMAGTFEEGFKEALAQATCENPEINTSLAQATCENPEINTSNCDPGNQVVDGKVVPLDLGE